MLYYTSSLQDKVISAASSVRKTHERDSAGMTNVAAAQQRRERLSPDLDVDIAIVGAGWRD